MSQVDDTLATFLALEEPELERLLDHSSHDQWNQLRVVLAETENLTEIEAAARIAEQALRLMASGAEQAGFNEIGPPSPDTEKLTHNSPKSSIPFPENERVQFSYVVRMIQKLLDRGKKTDKHGIEPKK